MFKKSPADYTDKTDYDAFNSHESHEFSRISDCIKFFILFQYYLTNWQLALLDLHRLYKTI